MKLDCFYMLRQHHDNRSFFTSQYDWITSSDWQASFQKFREYLAYDLANQDGLSIQSACDCIDAAFFGYITNSLTKSWNASHADAGNWLRKLAGKSRTIKQVWRRVRSFSATETKQVSLRGLLRPSSPYHSDFMPMYHAVTNSDPADY